MSGFDGGTECMMLNLNAALLVPFDIELIQPGSNGVHHSTPFHIQQIPCVRRPKMYPKYPAVHRPHQAKPTTCSSSTP
jgi:hypothetical protein